jgi:dTDP-6-deoxy-L-talose 4-dehydrogenase (NAD+)
MTQTLLITGATGFVGSQVLKALKGQDVQIRIVALESEKDKIQLNKQVLSVITTTDLFSETDEWWQNTCTGIDIIIHIAWYVEPGKYLCSPIQLDCLKGTLQLAKACTLTGVKRFVGIGTCFEYDLEPGYLSIETPLKPATPYAASKASAFLFLSRFFAEAKVGFAWCRLFYLFGEGEDNRRLVPYIRSKLEAGEPAELTSGNQIRDFMDVQEAGEEIAEIALGNHQGPVNICSAVPITIRELAEKIADGYGRGELLKFGARPDNLTDPPCVVGVKTLSQKASQ